MYKTHVSQIKVRKHLQISYYCLVFGMEVSGKRVLLCVWLVANSIS